MTPLTVETHLGRAGVKYRAQRVSAHKKNQNKLLLHRVTEGIPAIQCRAAC